MVTNSLVREIYTPPKRDSWGVVDPYAGGRSELLQFATDLKTNSDAIFETLLLGFELVDTVLNLIASFLVDITNPIKPIIEAILSTLNSILEDFRKAGFYFTYDKGFTENPSNFFGGYPAYEQRVIKKLLNKLDNTRPDFSKDTSVFAINLFMGVGLEGVSNIYAFVVKPLQELIALLKRDPKEDKLSAPNNVQVSYYKTIAGIKSEVEFKREISEESFPEGIKISWQLNGSKTNNPYFPSSYIAPKNFLVCVTTREKKEYVGIVKTRLQETNEFINQQGQYVSEVKLLENPSKIPARLINLVASLDQPIQRIGEVKGLVLVGDEEASPEKVSFVVMGQEDIYLEGTLKDTLQDINRVYILENPEGELFGFGNPSFQAYLPFEEMKIGDEIKEDYYVTIYSYNGNLELIKDTVVGSDLKYIFANKTDNYSTSSIDNWISVGGLSEPSKTEHVDIPTTQKNNYLRALREFYTVYLACGFNNPVTQDKIFGEQIISGETKKLLDGLFPNGKADLEYKDRDRFALNLLVEVENALLNTTLPSEEFIFNNASLINEINSQSLSFYEMFEKTDEGGDAEGYFQGDTIEGNPIEGAFAYYRKESLGVDTFDLVVQATEYFETDLLEEFSSYIENNPSPWPMLFVSNFKEGSRVYDVAERMPQTKTIMLNGLKLLRGNPILEPKGDWEFVRPFKNTDLSSIIDAVESFKSELESFLSMSQGVINEILKYIKLVKQRIEELRLIILKIKSLIDAILAFRLPLGLYGTYHITNGTQSLVNAISNAENKPAIDSKGVGAGAIIVAGGLPSILVDFFTLLLGGGDE